MQIKSKQNSLGFRIGVAGLALLFIIAGGLFLFSSTTSAQGKKRASEAPLSQEFLKYQEIQRTGGIWRNYTDEGYPLGEIPSPLDLEFYNGATVTELDGLAKKFDLRTKNKLTSVKDQGNCGSCWAFATFGSLESTLMPVKTAFDSALEPDFSEQHLITGHGFAYKKCAGGNQYMSMAYLHRGAGPVSEKSKPYKFMPTDGAPKVEYQVQDTILIPKRTSFKDTKKLKKIVQKRGAVYVSMFWVGTFYNYSTNSYYNTGTAEGGHAVLLVGWDDNFDKNKFNTPPPGNGAFIVRNSWGPNWGDQGFFYVSYYDKFFGFRSESMAFLKPVKSPDKTTDQGTVHYEMIYQYDPSGWINSYGYSSNTAWFANIFTAKDNTPIQAVGFYVGGSKNTYTVEVRSNVNANSPRSGSLGATKSGKVNYAGYVTVPLGKKVAVQNGQRFSVVVKLTAKGTNYPIPVEYHIDKYTKKIKGNKGESFMSSNGVYWDHTTDYKAKMNVCLKAYAQK